MCLAVPGQVETIFDDNGTRMGRVNFGGVVKEVCLAYLPELQVGDYAIVHVGFAIARVDEAEAVLLRQSQVRPTDVDVWYQLAETAGLAGNITGVHLARADFFYLHGAYHRSIQHLEYAQRLVRRTNPQLQVKLSQRIQDLRTEIRLAQQQS